MHTYLRRSESNVSFASTVSSSGQSQTIRPVQQAFLSDLLVCDLVLVYLFIFVFERGLIRLQAQHVVKDVLELPILLPLPPENITDI